jgi:predicted RNA-binding protein with PUA-like domain
MNYWLMKSEGDCYPITQLKKDKTTSWSGVRNFQARNYMKQMQVGDMVLFYHSNDTPSGVYGLAKVSKLAHPDLSAQDSKDEHYDSRSTKEKPIWECVDVRYVQTFAKPVSLENMKKNPKLSKIKILQKGSRLSICPVSEKEFEIICKGLNKI